LSGKQQARAIWIGGIEDGSRRVAITGCTGETYSVDGTGAIALDSENASELVHVIEFYLDHPKRYQAIRQAAPKVAAQYTWENILEILLEKICLAGERQRSTLQSRKTIPPEPILEADLRRLIRPPAKLALPAWSAAPEIAPLKQVVSAGVG
jgi:hypothetical protein